MKHLSIAVVRRPCKIVVRTGDPVNVLRQISLYLLEYGLQLDQLHYQRQPEGQALVILHCVAEQEVSAGLLLWLQRLPGVVTVERLGKSTL